MILGHHTEAEVKELIGQKNFQINAVAEARHRFGWTDTALASDWDSDWSRLMDRWAAARTAALIAYGVCCQGLNASKADFIPAEDDFQNLLRALTVTEGHFVKGDFQDLASRLATALSQASEPPINFSGGPPLTALDADLVAFKKADAVIRKGEAVTKKSVGIGLWIGGGIALLAGLVGYKVYVAPLLPKHEKREPDGTT